MWDKCLGWTGSPVRLRIWIEIKEGIKPKLNPLSVRSVVLVLVLSSLNMSHPPLDQVSLVRVQVGIVIAYN